MRKDLRIFTSHLPEDVRGGDRWFHCVSRRQAGPIHMEWPIHLPPTHQILQTAARPATSRCKVQGQKTNCVSWSPLYGIGMDHSLVCIILHRVYVKVYK